MNFYKKIQNIFILGVLIIAPLTCNAELTSLQNYINDKNDWMTKTSETAYFSARCKTVLNIIYDDINSKKINNSSVKELKNILDFYENVNDFSTEIGNNDKTFQKERYSLLNKSYNKINDESLKVLNKKSELLENDLKTCFSEAPKLKKQLMNDIASAFEEFRKKNRSYY